MLSEIGQFCLVMALGFAGVQVFASLRGVIGRVLLPLPMTRLGSATAYLQNTFVLAAFITLITAFLLCDFSILTVALHDHSHLPWYFRFAATWGNHEGSLLLFVLILSSMSSGLALTLKDPQLRARSLVIQGMLTIGFLLLLMVKSNPFDLLPFPLTEGESLNPILQDQSLVMHPPLLYLGYVGFSVPYSLAIAVLWGRDSQETWEAVVRPWTLLAWAALTGGITLGSWWAYYELGWGGWWFWDPVENASLMPWLAGTALVHTLRSGSLFRWSLFLSILTFSLSLLGTFLVRSGLITSVHSFAQSPDRGLFILSLLGFIAGFGLMMWVWKAPRLKGVPLNLMTRQGMLLLNSLFLCMGLITVVLGTFYPLWSEWVHGQTLSVGTPYFERTFIPLMIPVLILIPIGSLLRREPESLFSLFSTPLTAAFASLVLLLFTYSTVSISALTGIIVAVWVLVGTLQAAYQKRLFLGPTFAHLGVAISLLGVSVAGGFKTEESHILGLEEKMTVGGVELTLTDVQLGEAPTYLFEKATLLHKGGTLTPEKRVYKPQNSLLSETAITTNGLRDLYVILGPYQGDQKWVVKGSYLPLAPWIWIGGGFMVLGGIASLCKLVIARRAKPNAAIFNRGFIIIQRLLPPAFARGRNDILLVLILVFPLSLHADTQQAKDLQGEVRCPVCLGQAITDSDTEESEALRAYIVEQLNQGKSEEEVRAKLRETFGDEILFRPPFEERTFFLWLAPFFLLFMALAWIMWRVVRSRNL